MALLPAAPQGHTPPGAGCCPHPHLPQGRPSAPDAAPQAAQVEATLSNAKPLDGTGTPRGTPNLESKPGPRQAVADPQRPGRAGPASAGSPPLTSMWASAPDYRQRTVTAPCFLPTQYKQWPGDKAQVHIQRAPGPAWHHWTRRNDHNSCVTLQRRAQDTQGSPALVPGPLRTTPTLNTWP